MFQVICNMICVICLHVIYILGSSVVFHILEEVFHIVYVTIKLKKKRSCHLRDSLLKGVTLNIMWKSNQEPFSFHKLPMKCYEMLCTDVGLMMIMMMVPWISRGDRSLLTMK